MIHGKIVTERKEWSEALDVLEELFVKELQYQKEDVLGAYENVAAYAIVYEGIKESQAVAAGRLDYEGENGKLQYIGVYKEYRRKGYGDFIVRLLLNKAFTSGIKEVDCMVPVDVAPFFERVGFRKTEWDKNINGIKCNKLIINSENFIYPCRK